MNITSGIALVVSGGIIASSIILARIGLRRSVLSRKAASTLGCIGTGIGIIIFIFFCVSNGDLFGSIVTGTIAAITVGMVILIPNKWWR